MARSSRRSRETTRKSHAVWPLNSAPLKSASATCFPAATAKKSLAASGSPGKGCFVGGRYLVLAVTSGPPGEKLFGNFPDYTQLPEEASPKAFATVG